jgi:hypothetical protein
MRQGCNAHARPKNRLSTSFLLLSALGAVVAWLVVTLLTFSLPLFLLFPLQLLISSLFKSSSRLSQLLHPLSHVHIFLKDNFTGPKYTLSSALLPLIHARTQLMD